MADTRTPRKSATRETETRRKPWAPPSHLSAPDAPEGFVHRWIRVSMRGEEDKMNVNSKLREGWEPVRKDEYPDYEAPTIDAGRYEGVIGQGGLMLCRMPEQYSLRKKRVLRGPDPRTDDSCRPGPYEGTTSFNSRFRTIGKVV